MAGVKAAVAASGGIAALVALIARRPADDRAAEPAAGALANLAHDSPGNAAAIAAAGGVPPLVTLLGAPAERKTPEWAALTIQYTAQHHRPSQVRGDSLTQNLPCIHPQLYPEKRKGRG